MEVDIIVDVKVRKGLLSYDSVFKSVFINNENILGKMISDITGIDYMLLKDNLVLDVNEIPLSRKNEKFKRCDFIIRVENYNIINLEINRQSHAGLVVKNLSYLFKLFSSAVSKGLEYNDNLVVMQININCFLNENDGDVKSLSKYHLREDEDNRLYAKNLVIYDLNVVKCHELYYNKGKLDVPNYVRWGALIHCNDIEKVPGIVKGIMTYEERDLIMSELSKLTRDDLFMTEEEALKWAEWEANTIRSDARRDGMLDGLEQGFKQGIEQGIEKGIEQGIEKGIEQGIEQGFIYNIKNMLRKNISLEDISDITGKSIEEIEELRNKE